jgi:hypothetical protein
MTSRDQYYHFRNISDPPLPKNGFKNDIFLTQNTATGAERMILALVSKKIVIIALAPAEYVCSYENASKF